MKTTEKMIIEMELLMADCGIEIESYSDGLKEGLEAMADVGERTPTKKTKFKDAPLGARFKYPNQNEIWVKLNGSGDGLICQWHGNINHFQNICSFADEADGTSLETEIELI